MFVFGHLPLAGQEVPQRLTLEEAIDIAGRNNPGFLSTQNDQAAADWQVREAYGAFLPTVNASTGGSYTAAGEVRIGTITLENQSTDWVSSRYNLSFNWNLDGTTIFGLGNARASRRATEAAIDDQEFRLGTDIALRYLNVLRAQDQLDVTRAQLERNQQNTSLVSNRVAAGAVAGTDGMQAEVDLSTAEVNLIQAERGLRQARLALGEGIGSSLPEDVVLSSQFEVFEPSYALDALMQDALEGHPSLDAARAREDASRAQSRAMMTSQYLPRINVSGGLSGYTQRALNDGYIVDQLERGVEGAVLSCERNNALENGLPGGLPGYSIQDCSQIVVTEDMRQAALSRNAQFPFDFNENPFGLGVTVSLPIFTGFSRQRQVSQARNQAEDAQHDRRAEELRIRSAVTNAYDNVVSAHRLVQAEERRRALAEERLQLEQRRYALGAAGIILLLDAETQLSLAEQGYLNAVYDFHYNLIALEAAVGSSLRPL